MLAGPHSLPRLQGRILPPGDYRHPLACDGIAPTLLLSSHGLLSSLCLCPGFTLLSLGKTPVWRFKSHCKSNLGSTSRSWRILSLTRALFPNKLTFLRFQVGMNLSGGGGQYSTHLTSQATLEASWPRKYSHQMSEPGACMTMRSRSPPIPTLPGHKRWAYNKPSPCWATEISGLICYHMEPSLAWLLLQAWCPCPAIQTVFLSPRLTCSVFTWVQFFLKSPFRLLLLKCPRNFSQSFAWPGYDSLGGFLFSLGSVIRLCW